MTRAASITLLLLACSNDPLPPAGTGDAATGGADAAASPADGPAAPPDASPADLRPEPDSSPDSTAIDTSGAGGTGGMGGGAGSGGTGGCGTACPDGGASSRDTGVAVDPGMQWGLTSGFNEFNVTAITNVMDGCGVMPAVLVGMSRPVTYSRDQATIEIGNRLGSPPQPSLGRGMISGNTATLFRDNQGNEMNATCNWHEKLIALLTLINHDEFILDVTLTQSNISAGCQPKPPTDPCTSSWRWTFKKK